MTTALVIIMGICTPAAPAEESGPPWRLHRTGQITAQLTGISDQHGADALFGDILVGWNPTPIVIDLVCPEERATVVVGLLEPMWSEAGNRVQIIEAEGAEPIRVDIPVSAGGAMRPLGLAFTAADTDGDGRICVTVRAAEDAGDKNVVLSGIWLFDDGMDVDIESVVLGLDNGRARVVMNAGESALGKADEGSAIMDGRLIFGNGHVLGAFVGPLEEPESPVISVHDKISRLWLGYSSPQNPQVGLAPTVTDLGTGLVHTVGACDDYRFVDGVIEMVTALPVGTIRTQTFGLWDSPVMIRRMVFEPNGESAGPFELSTGMSLYQDHDSTPPEEGEALELFNQAYQDKREVPPSLRACEEIGPWAR